jgi:triosephosphate isomerase
MARQRPLVAGNWKMNGAGGQLAELDAVRAGLRGTGGQVVDVAICPPATLLSRAAAIAAGSELLIGGQDCHPKPAGAHTGDIAAEMLADAGARLVIVGHSERRADHGESDALVQAKAEAGWRAGGDRGQSRHRL